MALIDRFAVSDSSGPDEIPVHDFAWAMRLYLSGKVTKSQVVTAFGLDSSDEPQLDQINTHVQGLSSALEKVVYALEFEGILGLFHSGMLTLTQAKNLLNIT